MTLRLSVDSKSWHLHIHDTAKSFEDLIPVVKGNGYGFGRSTLMSHAASLAKEIAVGTVFEAHDVPATCTAIVLTPAGVEMPETLPETAILTVGSVQHVENLRLNSWRGQVIIKLRSSMNRYGADATELADLKDAITTSGLIQVGWSIHPPLDGNASDHLTEIKNWMLQISSDLPWFVSHIDASGIAPTSDVPKTLQSSAGKPAPTMKLSSSFAEYPTPTPGSVSPDDNDPPEGDDNDPPEGVTYPPPDPRFLAQGDGNLKCP